MSPLFRKSDEKRVQEAAAQAEIDRLRGQSPDELAPRLLAGLGPDGPGQGHTVRLQKLCDYLLDGFAGAGTIKSLTLIPRVRGALERLEQAGLAESVSYDRSPVWRITELGDRVLADGSLSERLAHLTSAEPD